MIEQVLALLTPPEVLSQVEFPEPRAIRPSTCPTSADLLALRNEIRTLGLLPIKSPEMHKLYNLQRDDPRLVNEVDEYVGTGELALATNRFPYQLPPDIEQWLLWTRLGADRNLEVAQFMADCLTLLNVTPDDLITFERSMLTRTKLVKGTFRAVRHLHFWVKI